ncbi:MAG: hypothetical protein U0804_12140 [Gemmataceae bacterium]
MYKKLWREGQHTDRMLSLVRNLKKRDLRKIRLFAVACCRRVWDYYPTDAQRELVVALEDYVENRVPWKVVQAKRKPAREWVDRAFRDEIQAMPYRDPYEPGETERPLTPLTYARCPIYATDTDVRDVMNVARDSMTNRLWAAGDHDPEQCDWLRCIFGNPYEPVTFEPSWRTEAVVGLARGMYESRDFGPMPVLADALEDAGCASADILAHCRGPGPHVRGCWVVDLVLGKA